MIQINDPNKRVQVIQTCLASMEYVNSAKRCGIYSYLLNYISTVQSGNQPPVLPGENTRGQSQPMQQMHPPPQQINIPRSMQPTMMHAGPGATHPSLLNAPTASSYSQSRQQNQLIAHTDNTPSWKVITDTPKQKALSYFSSCLEVLNIQEEVALTEEALKKAYRKWPSRHTLIRADQKNTLKQ